MHYQHKWVEVRNQDMNVVVAFYWHGGKPEYKWRCMRCGTEITAIHKPTPRFLKKRGLGRTCQEQLILNVMNA